MTAYVAVVGPGADARPDDLIEAREVGRLLAQRGAVVVCGGLGGVMAAVSAGAAEAGGVSVGLLPGSDRTGAAPDLTVALPTGLGQVRNALVVSACDAVIAVGGSWGTLSEVALALRSGRPVVGIGGWQAFDAAGQAAGPPAAMSAAEAVDQVLAQLAGGNPGGVRAPDG
jgi:uncharacterized protein (TIGR00725 family)